VLPDSERSSSYCTYSDFLRRLSLPCSFDWGISSSCDVLRPLTAIDVDLRGPVMRHFCLASANGDRAEDSLVRGFGHMYLVSVPTAMLGLHSVAVGNFVLCTAVCVCHLIMNLSSCVRACIAVPRSGIPNCSLWELVFRISRACRN
jgi:hypothetical protein